MAHRGSFSKAEQPENLELTEQTEPEVSPCPAASACAQLSPPQPWLHDPQTETCKIIRSSINYQAQIRSPQL